MVAAIARGSRARCQTGTRLLHNTPFSPVNVFVSPQPGDLPTQASIKFRLVINLRIAKALGLAVPPLLLARAGEMIELMSAIDLKQDMSWCTHMSAKADLRLRCEMSAYDPKRHRPIPPAAIGIKLGEPQEASGICVTSGRKMRTSMGLGSTHRRTAL